MAVHIKGFQTAAEQKHVWLLTPVVVAVVSVLSQPQPCPTDLVTSTDKVNYPNSASYYVTNGDTPLTGGFIDVAACVTKDGWGMSGRGSQPCAQGFYNPKDTYR